MEGRGEKKAARNAKAALRSGMSQFLTDIKEAARAKKWKWNLVPCGSRDEAYRAFERARTDRDKTVVGLLVDAEGPVDTASRKHWMEKETKWNLAGVSEDVLHLMIQTMETWIVADPDALSQYYGPNFQAKALPGSSNLEEVDKATVMNSLQKATGNTKKGSYHKIKHASELLPKIDSRIVRDRCPSCERLFQTILNIIATH